MDGGAQDLLVGALGAFVVVAFLVTCAIVLTLVVMLVRKHKQVHRPDVPASAKVAYYGSLVYTIFPIDLLPDPVLLDDIGVLVAALTYVGHTAKKLRAGGGTRDARSRR